MTNATNVMKKLMCLLNTEIENAVDILSKHYNFDKMEALEMLKLGEGDNKKCNTKKKNVFPIPFDGKMKDCCKGIKQNKGLYTQCEFKTKEGDYCGGCKSQKYGNVMDRMKTGLYEYRDPSGNKPTGYKSVLKKMKLSETMVREEALKAGIEIAEEHFSYEEESEVKEKKGRPKKAKKVIEKKEATVEDIFGKDEECACVAVEEKVEEKVEDSKVEDSKVEEKKAPRKQESAKGKAQKEKVVKEKVVKEKVVKDKKVVKAKVEEEEEADVVKRVEIDGKKYLKSKKTGIIYNMEEEMIGVWNEKEKKIDLKEQTGEETEEEYESEVNA